MRLTMLTRDTNSRLLRILPDSRRDSTAMKMAEKKGLVETEILPLNYSRTKSGCLGAIEQTEIGCQNVKAFRCSSIRLTQRTQLHSEGHPKAPVITNASRSRSLGLVLLL